MPTKLISKVSARAIAFIDSQVEDYQSLIAGVTPGTEAIVIDSRADGVAQITQVLTNRTKIDSIHIVSHGSSGCLQLGKTQLCAHNLETYRQQLRQWRHALNLYADILIYGCNVAAETASDSVSDRPSKGSVEANSTSKSDSVGTGVDSVNFLQRIAALTGANIAASANLTGSAAKGGDWELEYTTGDISASLAFEPETIATYNHVLSTFSPATNLPVGSGPWAVANGDLNGDSFPDLVVTNYFGQSVSILLGNGTGGFSAPTNFSVGIKPVPVVIQDFNGDNFPDLAVGNWETVDISILLGNGQGSFGSPTNFPVSLRPSSIAVGNFNGDSFPDMVVSNRSSNEVSIFLGDGTGRFGPARTFNVGFSPRFVVVGNFNADNFSDLAVANEDSNDVSILLGNGTGSFGPATNFSVGSAPWSVAVGKFNGDNFPDLVVTNQKSNNVSILLGNGAGGFDPAKNFSVGSTPRTVAVGDFNADNFLDLAVPNFDSNNVSILLGDGTGNFGTPTNFNVGTGPMTVTVGNFNADALPDLAVTNVASASVSILLNSINVNFQSPTYSGTEGNADTVVNIPVTLDRVPTQNITVPITLGTVPANSIAATEGTDFTLSTTSVTFLAGATGTALTQNIAVTIKPDNFAETDEKIILNFGTIAGASVGTIPQTTLTIPANDQIIYDIAAPSPTVIEGNSGTTPLIFTVSLSGGIDSASSVNYAIAGTANNGSDYNNIGGTSGGTGVTGTVNFAAGETSKTITLDVLGDAIIEPDETITVTLLNPVAPGQTPTITTAAATTTIGNDDTAGVTVNPASGLVTTETGGTATFTVKLNTQLSANVRIGLSSSKSSEGTVSSNSLTFTPANWNTPQMVTVTGVDDSIADGSQTYNIVTAAAVSTDSNYSNFNPADVSVTNSDNEIPGITVNPTAGLTTTEAGGTANFSVVLNTQPIAPVAIALTSSNPAEGNISSNSLTFTDANWNVPQTVTVTGVDDSIADGSQTYNIVTAAAVSTDSNYSNFNPADVSITNSDNEIPGITLTPASTTAAEGGATGSYTLQLNSQPTATVTVSFDTGNQISAIAPITFDSTNWNVAKPVTVMATDDAVVEGNHTGAIGHTATSTDANYNGITISPVSVAITDNDTAPTPIPVVTPPTPIPVVTPPTPIPVVTPPPPTPPTPPPPTPIRNNINNPPVLNYGPDTTPWHYRNLRVSNSSQFEYTFPQNTFTDSDPGDTLTYSATLSNGSPLPSWLNFNPNTRTFSGKSPTLQAFEIKLTATDKAGATAIDNIPIRVSSSGVIIDAYIAGANVFFDANKNSILDANEPSTITDANGEYELDIPIETFDKNRNGQIDPEEGNIVAIGGTDTATGLPLETPVSAPPDSTVVTLLTTLVADLMQQGISQAEAESKVKVAFGIPTSVDLTDLDPIVATKNSQPGGVETLAAMVKVQNLITQTATFIDGISTAGYPAINKAVVSAIASQVKSGTKLDLTNPAQLSAIIQQSVTNTKQFDSNLNTQKLLSIAPQVAQVMAEANQKVDRAIANFLPNWIPTEVARVQKVALSETAIDLKRAAAGIKPISEVVAENTGSALDAKIQGTAAPSLPATPIATGDIIPISDSIDSAVGTNGDDTLIGSNANDFISGKRGNDSLDGSLGDDTIYGGKGSDTVIGGNGEDILFGDRGFDSLIGGDGNDTLYGGKGNDTLIGGLGNNSLIGGAASDYFVLSANSAIDTIVDFEDGKDLIFLTNGLTFAQLDVSQSNAATVIKLVSNGQVLASLTGISANTINATDFAF